MSSTTASSVMIYEPAAAASTASVGVPVMPGPGQGRVAPISSGGGSSCSSSSSSGMNNKMMAPPSPRLSGAPAPPGPPKVVGPDIYGKLENYQLIRSLQAALFGGVYEAKGSKTGEKVAVKVLHKSELSKTPPSLDFCEVPLSEIRFKEQMTGHDHIVEVREAFEDEYCHYIVFELAARGDLLEALKSKPDGFSEQQCRFYIRHAARALAALHERKMAMQDVSLENMLIFVYDKENASSYASKEAPTASTETNDEKKSGSGPAESSISSHEDVIRIKICDPGQAVTFEIDPETGEEKPVAYRGLVGKSFRPPELSQKEPYIASKVDSWCLGWSTFYLLSALPLFLSADSNQKDAEYWNFFRRGDLEGLFRRKSDIDRKLSPTCMDFIMRLMRIVPKQRMSIKESLEHKWLADESVPRSLSTADLETAERKSLQYDRIRNQDHPIAMGVSTGPSFFNSRARSPQMRFQSPLGGRGFTSTVRSRSPLVTNFAPPLRSISPAPAGMISPMQLRPMKKAMPEPQSIGKTQLIHPEKVAAALAQSSSKASGVNADGTFIAEKVEAVLKQTQARSTSVSRIQAPPRTQSFFGSFGRPVRTSTAGGSATSSSGTSGGSASAAAGGSATTSSSQVASASSFSSSVLVGSGGPTLASSVAVGASPATSAVVSGSVSQGSGFRSVPFLGSSASQQGLSTLVQNRSKSNMFATSLGAAGGFGGASLGTSSATASSSLGIGPGGVRKMWPAQTPPVGASNMDVTQLMTKDQLGVAHYHNQQLPPASSSSSATSVGNISVAEEQVPAFIGEASTVVKPVVGTTSGSTSVSVNIPPAPGSLHQQQEQQPNPLVVGGTSNSKEQAIPNPIGATVPGPSSGPALSAAVVASPAPTAVSSASSSLGLHGNRTRSAMSFHFGAGPSQLQGQGSMFLGGQNATCVDLQSGGIAAGAAVAADSGTHGVSTSSGSSSSGKEQAALAARAGGNASCTSGSVLSVGRGGTTGPQPRALSKPPGSTTTTTSTSGFAGPPAPASRGFGMLGSPTIGGPGGSPFLGVQQLHNMPRSPLLDARLSGAGFPGLGVLYQPHPSSPPPPSKKSIASRRSVSTGPAANAHNRGSMAPRQGFAFQRGSPIVPVFGPPGGGATSSLLPGSSLPTPPAPALVSATVVPGGKGAAAPSSTAPVQQEAPRQPPSKKNTTTNTSQQPQVPQVVQQPQVQLHQPTQQQQQPIPPPSASTKAKNPNPAAVVHPAPPPGPRTEVEVYVKLPEIKDASGTKVIHSSENINMVIWSDDTCLRLITAWQEDLQARNEAEAFETTRKILENTTAPAGAPLGPSPPLRFVIMRGTVSEGDANMDCTLENPSAASKPPRNSRNDTTTSAAANINKGNMVPLKEHVEAGANYSIVLLQQKAEPEHFISQQQKSSTTTSSSSTTALEQQQLNGVAGGGGRGANNQQFAPVQQPQGGSGPLVVPPTNAGAGLGMPQQQLPQDPLLTPGQVVFQPQQGSASTRMATRTGGPAPGPPATSTTSMAGTSSIPRGPPGRSTPFGAGLSRVTMPTSSSNFKAKFAGGQAGHIFSQQGSGRNSGNPSTFCGGPPRAGIMGPRGTVGAKLRSPSPMLHPSSMLAGAFAGTMQRTGAARGA